MIVPILEDCQSLDGEPKLRLNQDKTAELSGSGSPIQLLF